MVNMSSMIDASDTLTDAGEYEFREVSEFDEREELLGMGTSMGIGERERCDACGLAEVVSLEKVGVMALPGERVSGV